MALQRFNGLKDRQLNFFMSPSSNWSLGHHPFTVAMLVRAQLGTPFSEQL